MFDSRRSILQRSGLLLAVLLLLVCPILGWAFPFGKHSGVTELTPANFNDFVNTHKPVVILFYAPWCGHCKQFHPEYMKFAQAMKGTVRVGAVNADTHSSLGQQFGIRGFPTIKYWKMGTKTISAPQDYQSARTAAAMQKLIVSDISSKRVQVAGSNADATKLLSSAGAKQGKSLVLLSSKTSVPPLFSVMAASPKLADLDFLFLGGLSLSDSAVQSIKVADLPAFAVVTRTGGELQPENIVVYPATAKKDYESVAKFAASCLAGSCDASGATEEKEAAAAAPTRSPQRALPLEPVDFTVDTLASFCSPASQKLGGQHAACVVSLTSDLDLAVTQRAFQNEPLLFFNGAAQREMVAQALKEGLGIDDAALLSGEGVVIVLRHTKAGVAKYHVFEQLLDEGAIENALQRFISGEVRMQTSKY